MSARIADCTAGWRCTPRPTASTRPPSSCSLLVMIADGHISTDEIERSASVSEESGWESDTFSFDQYAGWRWPRCAAASERRRRSTSCSTTSTPGSRAPCCARDCSASAARRRRRRPRRRRRARHRSSARWQRASAEAESRARWVVPCGSTIVRSRPARRAESSRSSTT